MSVGCLFIVHITTIRHNLDNKSLAFFHVISCIEKTIVVKLCEDDYTMMNRMIATKNNFYEVDRKIHRNPSELIVEPRNTGACFPDCFI